MSNTLPQPVTAFFEGRNARDFEAALSGFAAEAIVRDESRSHRGHDAINAWMEETVAQYDDRSELRGIETNGEDVVATAEVSGTFPGSPVTLRYRFTLEGDKIASLEIAP